MTRPVALSVALVAALGAGLVLALGRAPAEVGELAGMTDPRVSQENIRDTICRRGWTRTVRPPRDVTDAIKRNLAADRGVNVRDYELDHVVPLDLGGAPADLRNLRLQPWPEARAKDSLEVELSKAVCLGSVTLTDAQHQIAHDWRAACREWIGPQACGE
jgi:hypothetical protein